MNDPKYRGAHATTESTSTCLSPSVRNSSVNVHKSEKDVNYCWMFIGVTTPFWWANEQNKSCKEKKMKEGRCMMILIHDASIQFPITCDCCQLTNPLVKEKDETNQKRITSWSPIPIKSKNEKLVNEWLRKHDRNVAFFPASRSVFFRFVHIPCDESWMCIVKTILTWHR